MFEPSRKIALAAISIVALGLTASGAAAATTRASRDTMCRSLHQELQHALSTRSKARRAAEARELQKEAAHLCAIGKKAQGIRTYAKALKLVGVKPIDH